ncbi:MAG: LamG domain-containing protein, partial [Planctomycetota bacterium]
MARYRHDLYFGTSSEDIDSGAEGTFVGNLATTQQVVGFPGFPAPEGLQPGTTYYWRVDEVNDADPNSPWKGDIWSFSIPPRTAYRPSPADGVSFVLSDATLSWTGGFNAKLHHVYLGDNFDDVSNATGAMPLPEPTFAPGALEMGKTYYWRVDEFDGAATHKGDVWSFTTVPEIAIADPDLMGWWKLDENMGTTAVDWSGHGRHGGLQGDPQSVAGYDGGALEFDGSNHVDTGYAEDLAEWTIACWVKSPAAPSGASPSGPLHREQNYQFNWNHGNEVFRGAAAMNVGGTWHAAKYTPLSANTWYHLAATYDGNVFNAYRDGVLITSNMAPSGPANSESNSVKLGRHAAAAQFFTGTVDDARVYNRALTVEEIQEVMKGDTSVARHPNPEPRSTPNIGRAATLTWSPGDSAAQHDVYFGTNEAAVADADASDTTGVYRGRQPGASYSTAADIGWGGGPYYWRVDEFNTD